MENQVTIVPSAMAEDEARDAQENKLMGVLAYFGPLAFIPLLAKKDSPFAQYHAKQGITLFALDVVYMLLNWLLRLIKVTRTTEVWGIPVETQVTPWFVTLPLAILSIGILVLALIGIINAVKGRKQPLPLIGNINIIK